MSNENLVNITPAPILPGLQRLHDGMIGLAKVLSGVFARRRITAPDVTANQAQPQTDPSSPSL